MAQTMTQTTMTLRQLNTLVSKLITVPSTQNVWVTAELSDVAVRGGHCYMELIQKDEAGRQVAKARAMVWANMLPHIRHKFESATGSRLQSGIEVMLCVSVSFHAVFGYSLIISDINPEFTLGDLMRRRMETLRRLKEEGIIDLNRQLQWYVPTWRIAVISAQGAAGFGDFRRHLYTNQRHLRFKTALFPAIMQGERAPMSVISALEAIAAEADDWDVVVIIRGGGATSDLQAFEDYDLAAAVSQFPLPVISGVGHERDTTVLDHVANYRVITPTAAADLIINFGTACLEQIADMGADIARCVTDRLAGEREHLGYASGLLPVAPMNALARARNRLDTSSLSLTGISSRRIAPALERLAVKAENIPDILARTLRRANERLDASQQLLDVLSPQAVLARGYSITRTPDGHAVTDSTALAIGDIIVTTLASGTVHSTVNKSQEQNN